MVAAQLRELAASPSCGAQNGSTPTSCAEEDNINVPLYGGRVERFQIVALHPAYSVGADNCDADFSTCNFLRGRVAADSCERLLDDGVNVVQLCTVPNWWRSFAMTVAADGGRTASGHYVVLYRKIADEASWPQFLVLYEDGNLRLKPHPQHGAGDPYFSSSVILGPAVSAARPFVDIERIRVTLSPLALDGTFRDGQGAAHLDLTVDRTIAVVTAQVGYTTGPAVPFATFRSMWVSNGNADVDHVQTEDGLFCDPERLASVERTLVVLSPPNAKPAQHLGPRYPHRGQRLGAAAGSHGVAIRTPARRRSGVDRQGDGRRSPGSR